MQKKPKVDHLRRLTDKIGLAEHGRENVPDLDEGYCVDDNARALEFCSEAGLDKLTDKYLAFVAEAARQGGFANDFEGGKWRKNENLTGDHFGRAMRALAKTAVWDKRQKIKEKCLELFDYQMENIEKVKYTKTAALIMDGLRWRYELDKKEQLKDRGAEIAKMLMRAYEAESDENWRWFEDKMTYDNGRLPEALWMWSDWSDDRRAREIAKNSLDFYISLTENKEADCFSFPGNHGWFDKGGKRARWDQQPIEAGSLSEACCRAYEVSGKKRYKLAAKKALDWYWGRNIKSQVMVTEAGGVYDGLEEEKTNTNQGAESTLSYLLAWQAYSKLD